MATGFTNVHTRLRWIAALGLVAACGSSDDTVSLADSGASDSSVTNDGGSQPIEAGVGSLPTHAASSLAFTDHDPAQNSVDGVVAIAKAVDETDLTTYDLYWAGSATVKLAPIATLPKTGKNLSYHLTAPIPNDATYLLVFTANNAGEMKSNINAPVVDDEAYYVNVSGDVLPGDFPSGAIDTSSGKLLLAPECTAPSVGERPLLYRCNLDGTSCAATDISASQGPSSGQLPAVAVDATNHKLLVATNDGANSNKPALFRCDLDGTGCTYSDISAGQGTNSAGPTDSVSDRLVLLVDSTNQKILVVTEDSANSGKPAVFRCNLDGSSCTFSDISAGQGGGDSLSAAIDTTNQKLVVVDHDNSNFGKPGLFRCNLDGSNCTHTDLSAGQGSSSALWTSIAVDISNQKLLVVTQNGSNSDKLALFRCNLDGTGCLYTDISAGQPANSGYYPSAAIDTTNQKLLVTAFLGNAGQIGFYRCSLDGTSCTHADVSAGHVYGWQQALFDAANGRLLIVGTETVHGDPTLVYFGL